jgi:hypothetical protein
MAFFKKYLFFKVFNIEYFSILNVSLLFRISWVFSKSFRKYGDGFNLTGFFPGGHPFVSCGTHKRGVILF